MATMSPRRTTAAGMMYRHSAHLVFVLLRSLSRLRRLSRAERSSRPPLDPDPEVSS